MIIFGITNNGSQVVLFWLFSFKKISFSLKMILVFSELILSLNNINKKFFNIQKPSGKGNLLSNIPEHNQRSFRNVSFVAKALKQTQLSPRQTEQVKSLLQNQTISHLWKPHYWNFMFTQYSILVKFDFSIGGPVVLWLRQRCLFCMNADINFVSLSELIVR